MQFVKTFKKHSKTYFRGCQIKVQKTDLAFGVSNTRLSKVPKKSKKHLKMQIFELFCEK